MDNHHIECENGPQARQRLELATLCCTKNLLHVGFDRKTRYYELQRSSLNNSLYP